MKHKAIISVGAVFLLLVGIFIIASSQDVNGLRIGAAKKAEIIAGCGDAVCDAWESFATCSADCSVSVIDSDSDFLNDEAEEEYGVDPFNRDSDNDGIIDGLEVIYGSDPQYEDTDLDGYNDLEEVEAGTDPLSFYDHPLADLTIAELIPTTPLNGSNFTISFSIENIGDGTPVPPMYVTVGYKYDNVDFSDTIEGEIRLAYPGIHIAPGEKYTIEMIDTLDADVVAALSPGVGWDIDVEIMVDSEGLIDEYDETNNLYVGTFSVVG